LIPQPGTLTSPLFFSEEEMNELRGSSVFDSVNSHRERVKRKFKGVDGHVLNRFREAFPADVYTLENYMWAHAIMDSRSIWWGGGRHLTPMLDMINCMEGPSNPERVHSTRLDAKGTSAVTLAPWAVPKGEQVWENYGQPNHIYFEFHGFSLPSHPRLCAHGARTRCQRPAARGQDEAPGECWDPLRHTSGARGLPSLSG